MKRSFSNFLASINPDVIQSRLSHFPDHVSQVRVQQFWIPEERQCGGPLILLLKSVNQIQRSNHILTLNGLFLTNCQIIRQGETIHYFIFDVHHHLCPRGAEFE